MDVARLITAGALFLELMLAPFNLVINGTLPKYQSYRGMGYVRNSMLAQTDAFSLGPVAFINKKDWEDPEGGMNTIRHEYGHYLQWKDYGGLGYIGRGIKSKFFSNAADEENKFELNADERACEQFSRSPGFRPVYYQGRDRCAHFGY